MRQLQCRIYEAIVPTHNIVTIPQIAHKYINVPLISKVGGCSAGPWRFCVILSRHLAIPLPASAAVRRDKWLHRHNCSI